MHWLWGSSFFWKCSKFYVDLRNAEKNSENVFYFWEYSIWIRCVKLSVLRREYLSPAVNVLTKSLNILHGTKIEFFQLISFHSDQYIWQRCRRAYWNSVWAHLPCCLGKGPLKPDFSDISLISYFGVPNIGNTSIMRVTFLLEMFKN